MPDLTPSVPSPDDLWRQYLKIERDGARGVKLAALETFVARMLAEPAPVRSAWAKSLAEAIADRNETIPVRLPLLRSILAPALVEGVLAEEPGCARWLASFDDSQLLRCDLSSLPENLRAPWLLLKEAVRIDPDDDRARRRLVEHRAQYFRYTLHELPAGVLYGMDGATAKECDELIEELNEFKSHIAALAQQECFAELIGDCEFHYRAYADYRRSGNLPGGYHEYLRTTFGE